MKTRSLLLAALAVAVVWYVFRKRGTSTATTATAPRTAGALPEAVTMGQLPPSAASNRPDIGQVGAAPVGFNALLGWATTALDGSHLPSSAPVQRPT